MTAQSKTSPCIFVLSPQPWDGFKVSKHHYAAELARRGYRIYFLETTITSKLLGTIELHEADTEGVKVVRYAGFLFRHLNFRAKGLYSLLCRWKAKQIMQKLGVQPDIVWDFDNLHQFPNLSVFGDAVKIYHPVDVVQAFDEAGKHADLIISLSEELIPVLMRNTLPCKLIPHGLNESFVQYARQIVCNQTVVTRKKEQHGRTVVGYVGNLDAFGIDWLTLEQMISTYPGTEFRLIGPYANVENVNPEFGAPVKRLATYPNCIFTGRLSNQMVLEQASEIDIWLLCYDPIRRPDATINSHKVLEYLATGKPVLSHWMKVHQEEEFVCMPTSRQNADMTVILGRMLNDIALLSATNLIAKRANYALQFSYTTHVDTALAFIADHKPNATRNGVLAREVE